MITYDYNGYKLNEFSCDGYIDKNKCIKCKHHICNSENARKYIKEKYGIDIKISLYPFYIIIGLYILIIFYLLFLLFINI